MTKSDQICAELRRRGYNVQWKEDTDDQTVIAIDFIGNRECPWVRAFHVDKAMCTADMFQGMIEGWKADVRKDRYLNKESDTVIAVIQRYGVKKFTEAMKERVIA